MTIPDRIRNAVYNGYVLDDAGEWVPIAQMLAKEREFLSHLEKGEVICDEQWVSLAQAKKVQQ
jgi:hypothetical protein